MDTYFAATPSATPGSMAGRPAVPQRQAVGLRVVASSLLGAAVLTLALHVVQQSRGAPPLSPVRQALGSAPAAAGWGPEFVDDLGRPARVDPCTPMTYAVDLTSAPAGALTVVRKAIGSLTEASGLRFTETTSARPRLLISWTPSGTTADGDGVASAVTHTRAIPSAAGPVIVGGEILINSARTFAEGGAVRHESLRLVLLHELGHAVGLRHVAGSGQVMGAVAHPWLADYASGDRLGLRILGTGPCLPSPNHVR